MTAYQQQRLTINRDTLESVSQNIRTLAFESGIPRLISIADQIERVTQLIDEMEAERAA